MAEIRVAFYPSGIDVPERLLISGAPPNAPGAERTGRAFAIDWTDPEGNIFFHFNPRPEQGRIILNSYIDDTWGVETSISEYPLSADPDVPFQLQFDVLDDAFHVSTNGRTFCEFPHRASPSRISEVRSTAFVWRLECGRGRLRLVDRLKRRPLGRALPPEVVPAFPAECPNRDWAPQWVVAESNPATPDSLDSFRLFAILCTWMEEDVIEACVGNAFRQGCERVYVVDNGSPDRTVERAVAAGATLAGSFDQGYFDEGEKMRQLERVVDEISPAEAEEHIWWLWLDADEFHHGPGGLTLREYLESLDRRFRIVGSRLFHHLPAGEPAYVEGRHPLDFQPLCSEVSFPYCDLGHWKHPLRRWDRNGPRIERAEGFHTAASADRLLEPTEAVFLHHFPFREETATRARLERLFGRRGGAPSRVVGMEGSVHMRVRLRALDAVYRQRWDGFVFFPPCAPGYVPELRSWEAWVHARDAEVARLTRERSRSG